MKQRFNSIQTQFNLYVHVCIPRSVLSGVVSTCKFHNPQLIPSRERMHTSINVQPDTDAMIVQTNGTLLALRGVLRCGVR